MITVEQAGPYTGMNDWIISKHERVLEFLKNVIDVPPAEEYLKVNKYGELARKEKASIVILLRQICQLHALLAENKDDITDGAEVSSHSFPTLCLFFPRQLLIYSYPGSSDHHSRRSQRCSQVRL